MKSIIIFSLLIGSFSFADSPAKDKVKSYKISTSYKNKNEEVYKTIMKDLDQIGEKNDSTPNRDEFILIQRITELLSWNYSSSTKENIELTSGIFAMLAPRKNNLQEGFEEDNYKSIFSSDNYGSAFLYKDYIVTNYHMCRGLNTIIRDFNNNIYGVKVLKFDIKQDVCILKAPSKVQDQRNFATYTMPLNPVSEEIHKLRIENKILKIKSKNYLSDRDKNELFSLEKEKKSDERDYGFISGAYGEFYIYNITEDNTKDDWTKNFAYKAFGEKCKGGVSGSPVSSKKGLVGLFWGAEQEESRTQRIRKLSERSPSYNVEKNPTCFFVSVSEIDRLISEYEKEQLTKTPKDATP